jgi:hypothetical protein
MNDFGFMGSALCLCGEISSRLRERIILSGTQEWEISLTQRGERQRGEVHHADGLPFPCPEFQISIPLLLPLLP